MFGRRALSGATGVIYRKWHMLRFLSLLFLVFAGVSAFVAHYRASSAAFWTWSSIGLGALIVAVIMAIVLNGGHTGGGFIKPMAFGLLQLGNIFESLRGGGEYAVVGGFLSGLTCVAALVAYVVATNGRADEQYENDVDRARYRQNVNREAARRNR